MLQPMLVKWIRRERLRPASAGEVIAKSNAPRREPAHVAHIDPHIRVMARLVAGLADLQSFDAQLGHARVAVPSTPLRANTNSRRLWDPSPGIIDLRAQEEDAKLRRSACFAGLAGANTPYRLCGSRIRGNQSEHCGRKS
jgi:hypothetical protein